MVYYTGMIIWEAKSQVDNTWTRAIWYVAKPSTQINVAEERNFESIDELKKRIAVYIDELKHKNFETRILTFHIRKFNELQKKFVSFDEISDFYA